MEILLLGTAAAEGVPALYSDTRVSSYAREHGGREVRTRSGALIDGELKIDLPPDTLVQTQRERLDARDWTGLLFTHGDDDHFAANELQYFLFPFSQMDLMGFTIYGNERICGKIQKLYPDWPIDLVQINAFQTFKHSGYTITPIEARHNMKEECQNHIVERGGKRLLYATDTGIWRDETWEFLSDFKLDLLVIECTEGLQPDEYEGHLSCEEVLYVVNRLKNARILRPDGRVVTTHHSHNGNATYAELAAFLEPYGIEAGYDGMKVEI